MVTRNDVARRAGTSPAVVSYVLNKGPRPVSAVTSAKVMAAIEELGYRPNHLARALRVKRSMVLGLLMPDASNPFFASLARALEDLAYDLGYALLVGNATEDDEREARYVSTFVDRQVDGLLLISSGKSRESMRELNRARVPLVMVDRLLPEVPASTIVVDNEMGGYLATAHLMEHGHTQIACLAGPNDLSPSSDRHRGWARALRVRNLRPEDSLLVRSRFERAAGYEATRRLLEGPSRPTALFATADIQAVGALRAASEAGLRVPEDLAVASFDGIPEAAFTVPGLTTIVQPIELIARRTMELILERIRDPETPATAEVVPVGLIRRGSCGCPEPRGVPTKACGVRVRTGISAEADPSLLQALSPSQEPEEGSRTGMTRASFARSPMNSVNIAGRPPTISASRSLRGETP